MIIMRIITRKALLDFALRFPTAHEPLDRWFRLMSKSRLENLQALRAVFPSADPVGRYTVFNIGGNKYRLITEIQYKYQKCFIRHVLTHQEYDTEAWKHGHS
jgi:mRNA interferase HigB